MARTSNNKDYSCDFKKFLSIILDYQYQEETLAIRLKEQLEEYLSEEIENPNCYRKEKLEKRLKLIKKRTYLNAEDIADILNIKKTTVKRWREEYITPSTATIVDLAKIFKVPTDFILGIIDLPEREIYNKYEVLKEYCLDSMAFDRLHKLKNEDHIQFMYVIEGLNLLLNQKDSPFGILNKIGNYLLVQRMKGGYFYFDEDDLENLCEQLEYDSKIGITTKETLDNFKEQCYPFSMNTVGQDMLDKITEEIVKYKKVVTPSFFEQEDNIEHLFERKTKTDTDNE